MAEEAEKKPEFVLRKKKPEAAAENSKSESSSLPAKKKIVIKKKNPSPNAGSEGKPDSNSEERAKNGVHVVVKKPTPAPSPAQKPSEQQEKPRVEPAKPEAARPAKSFELNSARPNVKAGNLSDKRQGGYNRDRNGYNGNRGGYGQNGGRSGGFTGAQAREGYQNRERDNNRQGGFNRNGGQGGFNRNGGQGGFNRGGFNGQGGQGRPGFGNRPGFGGQGGNRPGFGGPRPQGGGFAPRGGFAPAPMPAPQAGKKQFKGKKQVYGQRKDKEELFDEEELYKKKQTTQASVVPKSIDIMETISVSDLAKKMNLKAGDIIAKLMGMGMMVTINQSIDSDTATLLADEYGCEVHLVSLYDETVIEHDVGDEENLRIRPPIVTVMGHVDHGKTKTLDAIRKTNVVAGEAGGITQKIGAYQVHTEKGTITFLDTPGHEAFTMMRARGAQITDIVVLVVAADDGVMPQTLEALSHAKDAKVPIIVAVNKIDKPDANPENVMTQLSNQGLTPEEWGGDTQYVKISALRGQGIDDLLDAILLQAEVLELKAQYDTRAEGKVIESRIDQGRGVVASVVVQSGTLKIGDPFVAGIYSGRVRAMFNDRGEKVLEALPSMPVEVLGLDDMPNAGDPFQVTETEKDARAISAKRQELKRFEAAKAVKKVNLDNLVSTIQASEINELKVIIKADLQGSAEALKTSLEKLSTPEIRLNVIHSSAGAINESDVTLAAADGNAILIGFNVRPTPKAKLLAEQEKVDIRKYNIIYKCVEEITLAMEGMLKPDTKEEVTGQVEVRNTFRVPKVGVIAGCYVTEGVVKRTSSVNLIRDGIVKYTGKITSLKRFKDDAKEVTYGFECGIGLENWQDIQEGDVFEVFEYVEIARKLGDSIAKEKEAAAKAAAEGTGSASEE
ncbi:translation initiation factor IF-2 [Treponema ruminis]|uniref:Translation initiation factor IF-2 n=1 Tax=Treponema ruminis TaxID=744515 RepID=A0A7W8G7V0_9SPIR|nr:translation initiation factor IF-2 [Treponema ruminis]MBB5225478.1 translation initiation factor IF-2 [Treponema ruminis]QSI01652.1 translation initiation factor IF-2 [Treponema ruminis]